MNIKVTPVDYEYRFDIRSHNMEALTDTLIVAFNGKKASGWGLGEDGITMYLYSGYDTSLKGYNAFPVVLEPKELSFMIKQWLEVTYQARKPHIDDLAMGYRVFNERYEHVNDTYLGFIAIQPLWMVMHK